MAHYSKAQQAADTMVNVFTEWSKNGMPAAPGRVAMYPSGQASSPAGPTMGNGYSDDFRFSNVAM